MRTLVLELVSAVLITSAIVSALAAPGIANAERARLQEALQDDPQLVFVGNSMLGEGVDPARVGTRLSLRCALVWRGGAASAWWTVALKNHVLRRDPPPRAVVLAFRDTFLTQPTFRVDGDYGAAIRALQDPREPLLDSLVWTPALGLSARLPVLVDRHALRESVDRVLTRVPAAIVTRQEPSAVAAAARETFADSRMLERELTRAQLREERSADATEFKFSERLPESLLPAMVEEASRAGVRLILVRIRRRAHAQGSRSLAVEGYVRELKAWAEARDVALLDFASEERLSLDLFASGDHLGPEGRAVFSDLLAERLAPLLR